MNTHTTSTTALDSWDVAYDAALEAVTLSRAAGTFGNTAVYGAVAQALAAAGYTPAEARTSEVRGAIAQAMESYRVRRELAAILGEAL